MILTWQTGFQRFDMAKIRARENSTAIAPPGTAVPQMEQEEEEAENPEPSWVCYLADDARLGVPCGAVFATSRALAMHQRRAHNFGFFLSRRVALNACPNCCSIISSIATAIHHLIRAYERGHCPRQRSLHAHIIRTGGKDHELQCRICHEWCTHPTQLLPPHSHAPLACATSQDQALPVFQTGQNFDTSKRHDNIWMAELRVASGKDGGKKRRADEEPEAADTMAPKAAPAKEKGKAKGREGERVRHRAHSTATSCRQSPG